MLITKKYNIIKIIKNKNIVKKIIFGILINIIILKMNSKFDVNSVDEFLKKTLNNDELYTKAMSICQQ